MKRSRDILCNVVHRVSMAEYSSDPDRANHYANVYLKNAMTDFIVLEKAEESNDDFCREYRLELYVATPKEFWKIVEREAQEIASRFKWGDGR